MKQKGFVTELSILVGLLVVTIAIPLTTKLVQERQEIRKEASQLSGAHISCPSERPIEVRSYGECCSCGKAKEVKVCRDEAGDQGTYWGDCVHDSPGCVQGCVAPGEPTPSPNCSDQKNQILSACVRVDCDGTNWMKVEKWCDSNGYSYEKTGRPTGLACDQPKPGCVQPTATPIPIPTSSCQGAEGSCSEDKDCCSDNCYLNFCEGSDCYGVCRGEANPNGWRCQKNSHCQSGYCNASRVCADRPSCTNPDGKDNETRCTKNGDLATCTYKFVTYAWDITSCSNGCDILGGVARCNPTPTPTPEIGSPGLSFTPTPIPDCGDRCTSAAECAVWCGDSSYQCRGGQCRIPLTPTPIPTRVLSYHCIGNRRMWGSYSVETCQYGCDSRTNTCKPKPTPTSIVGSSFGPISTPTSVPAPECSDYCTSTSQCIAWCGSEVYQCRGHMCQIPRTPTSMPTPESGSSFGPSEPTPIPTEIPVTIKPLNRKEVCEDKFGGTCRLFCGADRKKIGRCNYDIVACCVPKEKGQPASIPTPTSTPQPQSQTRPRPQTPVETAVPTLTPTPTEVLTTGSLSPREICEDQYGGSCRLACGASRKTIGNCGFWLTCCVSKESEQPTPIPTPTMPLWQSAPHGPTVAIPTQAPQRTPLPEEIYEPTTIPTKAPATRLVTKEICESQGGRCKLWCNSKEDRLDFLVPTMVKGAYCSPFFFTRCCVSKDLPAFPGPTPTSIQQSAPHGPTVAVPTQASQRTPLPEEIYEPTATPTLAPVGEVSSAAEVVELVVQKVIDGVRKLFGIEASPVSESTPVAGSVPLGGTCTDSNQCMSYDGSQTIECWEDYKCKKIIFDVNECQERQIADTEIHECPLGMSADKPDGSQRCCPDYASDCIEYCGNKSSVSF